MAMASWRARPETDVHRLAPAATSSALHRRTSPAKDDRWPTDPSEVIGIVGIDGIRPIDRRGTGAETFPRPPDLESHDDMTRRADAHSGG
jgi:hypothetical protein